MKIFFLVVLVLLTSSCSSLGPPDDSKAAWDVGLKTSIYDLSYINYDKQYRRLKDNKFIKKISSEDDKYNYIYCLTKLKWKKKLTRKCRDFYEKTVKMCFSDRSFVGCGMVNNLSRLYNNEKMAKHIKIVINQYRSKRGNHEILENNDSLLYDDKSPITNFDVNFSAGVGFVEDSSATGIFGVGLSFGGSTMKETKKHKSLFTTEEILKDVDRYLDENLKNGLPSKKMDK